jgi:acyl-CoA dehydrogenase
MDFELTDSQQEIVRAVRALCERFPDEYWRGHDARHEFPHEFYKAIAEAGYLGIAIPEEYGGSGLGITEAALIMREVAYAGAMNAASSIHLGIYGLTPLVVHGS